MPGIIPGRKKMGKGKKQKEKFAFRKKLMQMWENWKKPVGLTFPSKLETVKGTAVVMLSMAVCSAFVAGVDTATALLVSKL